MGLSTFRFSNEVLINKTGLLLIVKEINMQVFIVFAHPESQSFNGALLRTAIETLNQVGHQVEISDLYAMKFNPVSGRHNFTSVKEATYFKQQVEEMYATETQGFVAEIEMEMQKIERCDLMIWQFPLWWFSVPAILKGWIDRVFVMGRFYSGGRYDENKTCQGKRALLSLTTGVSKRGFTPEGFNGDIEGILRPIQRGILQFMCFDVLEPHIVYSPDHISEVQRQAALQAYAQRLQNIAHETPIPLVLLY